ncbi:MAG: pilus assembly protein, partial [Proteobacteria bacterium]|nr:pilus assembly protein [Pseudomonadota bacterium]
MRSSRARQFAAHEGGAVAIIFSLSILVILGAVGGAIDYSRAVTARDQVQASVDAAVLAAARFWQIEQNVSSAQERGLDYYNTNKPKNIATSIPRMTVDDARGSISMDVDVTIAAPFLTLLMKDGFSFTAHAEAMLPIGENAQTNIEIALMLDTTGSMGGQKMVDLKAAATDLIDIVVYDNQSKYTSKVALAPFAPRVKVGSYAPVLTGLPATSGSKKLVDCVTERTGAKQFNDDAPAAGAYLGWYTPT